MKIVIDIPDNEIPTKQDLLSIDLCFFKGKVSQCDYPFMELPKGHGRLIDEQSVINSIANTNFWLSNDNWHELMKAISNTPTIIEAYKEREE